jgi:hypothetical protein
MQLQNVMDKWLKKDERRAPNRAFTTRPEIKDTMEDHIEGSASFEMQNIK